MPKNSHLLRHSKSRSGAFTLIELMVAVALLIFLIIGVGTVFKSASSAVGLSEATGGIFAQFRAINQQLETDIHGINKNGFLVIRCRAETTADSDYDPNNVRFRRYDQISFISTGKFPNRTGAFQSANLFADTTTSNTARIWYGQLYVDKDTAISNETTPVGVNFPPTSFVGPHTGSNPIQATLPLDPAYESGFILGRQAMLILNAPPTGFTGTYPSGFTSISQYTPTNTSTPTPFAGAGKGPANITSPTDATFENQIACSITASRVDVAYTSLSQEVAPLTAMTPAAIAQAMCYRLKVLPAPNQTSVLDATTSLPYLPNGVFRMHPVLAKGAASFAVDWTDGNSDGNGNLRWFGLNSGIGGSYAINMGGTRQPVGGTIDAVGNNPPGDNYCAVFTPNNAASWPKALRFSYRITDPNDRLSGGRTFVCVVDLP